MTQPKTRHVWVRREYDPRTVAGLVLEWQQREGGIWWAHVVYVLDGDPLDADPVEPNKCESAPAHPCG